MAALKWGKQLERLVSSKELDIMYFGDSDIARWPLAPPRVGAGGATMAECSKFAPRISSEYGFRIKILIVLAGENDLAQGSSPESVVLDAISLANQALEFVDKIFFISTKPEPATLELYTL